MAVDSSALKDIHVQNLAAYRSLARPGQPRSLPFFDCIVLTAANDSQKTSFEADLRSLRPRLPTSRYIVVADPPGPRVGSGGSTLGVLAYLERNFKNEWRGWKILLVHAGGYSKRLANHSIFGKAFAAFPYTEGDGGVPWTMLEVTLASLCGMVSLGTAPPGVTVASSDVLLVFDPKQCDLTRGGITALANLSSPDIGRSHGVFVINKSDRPTASGSNTAGAGARWRQTPALSKCTKFLHKPSVDDMKARGAAIPTAEANSNGQSNSFQVYTDSVFFVDIATCQKLIKFYQANSPLECELEAWGDLMQPLGRDADDSYTSNVSNVGTVTRSLIPKRKALFAALRGVELHACLLEPAQFYHLGTLPELLRHTTVDPVFRDVAGVQRNVYSVVRGTFTAVSAAPQGSGAASTATDESPICSPAYRGASPLSGQSDSAPSTPQYTTFLGVRRQHNIAPRPVVEGSDSESDNARIGSTVMVSIVDPLAEIDPGCILEYCDLGAGVTVRSQCVLSHVTLKGLFVVPDMSFMMTVALPTARGHSGAQYCTIAMRVDDDLKATIDSDACAFGVPWRFVQEICGVKGIDMFRGGSRTLWDARLFPVCSNVEDSAAAAVDLLSMVGSIAAAGPKIADYQRRHEGRPRLSFGEVVAQADLAAMSALRSKITNSVGGLYLRICCDAEVPVATWATPGSGIVADFMRALEGEDRVVEKQVAALLDEWKRAFFEEHVHAALAGARDFHSLGTLARSLLQYIPEGRPGASAVQAFAASNRKWASIITRDSMLTPFVFGDLPVVAAMTAALRVDGVHGSVGDSGVVPPPARNAVSNAVHDLPLFLRSCGGRKDSLAAGKKAYTALPARINLAGGWTDTPPYCLERGGSVLNMAVLVNGDKPITATVTVLSHPVLRLSSKDQSGSEETLVVQLRDLLDYTAAGVDRFCLAKAVVAFCLCPQLCSEVGGAAARAQPLQDIHEALLHGITGGLGLEVETNVHLPRGTGLGTSSILALALLRSIKGVFGCAPATTEQATTDEFNAVLAIEQMMTTGGGWQDQIGGGTNGIKLITTDPSIQPQYKISVVDVNDRVRDVLNKHLLVVYTGQQRLAKTVLDSVVDRWISRVPGTANILEGLADVAHTMYRVFVVLASSIEQNAMADAAIHFSTLGGLLERHKSLGLQLEPASITADATALMAAMSVWVTGSYIIGAGSGGFVVGWLKQGQDRAAAVQAINNHSPNTQVWDVTLCI